MRMVRWMCGVKLKDRLPSKELRERLGIDDIALILQQNIHHTRLIMLAKTNKHIRCDAGDSNSDEIFVQNFRYRAIG